jgi:hypothetical protein
MRLHRRIPLTNWWHCWTKFLQDVRTHKTDLLTLLSGEGEKTPSPPTMHKVFFVAARLFEQFILNNVSISRQIEMISSRFQLVFLLPFSFLKGLAGKNIKLFSFAPPFSRVCEGRNPYYRKN